MNDDKLCIFPDALIAMIVTEAQDRALRDLVMDMRMRRWKKDDFEHSKPVVWPESYTRRP